MDTVCQFKWVSHSSMFLGLNRNTQLALWDLEASQKTETLHRPIWKTREIMKIMCILNHCMGLYLKTREILKIMCILKSQNREKVRFLPSKLYKSISVPRASNCDSPWFSKHSFSAFRATYSYQIESRELPGGKNEPPILSRPYRSWITLPLQWWS